MTTTEKAEPTRVYDKQARMYDRLRKKKKSLDHKWRERLLAFAKGKILEVSVGSGANFKFYPRDADVTAVDLSSAMIKNAMAAAKDSGIKAQFITSRVEDLDFPTGSFDTIVSTLSLCAYDNPVKVLNLFSRWSKKSGMILLLEHGVSKYKIIHWLQNKIDRFQYRQIGCHANRDILDIVKHANLKLVACERKLLGAIYLILAKPIQ